MRYLLFILLASIASMSSCESTINNNVSEDGTMTTSKKIYLPINPCDYISRDIILSRFNIAAEDIELRDENMKSNSDYSKCGYTWKKSNYEELQDQLTDAMLDYATQGMNIDDDDNKIKLSDITRLDSPNGLVQIGYFKVYKNIKSAKFNFGNSHKVPSKEDMEALHKELNKQGLDKDAKEAGKSLSGGIANSMKFTKIDDIGDQAFFDHLNRSLDVRFGTFSFSVFIDSELDFDTNIKLAKEIAQEVWEKL